MINNLKVWPTVLMMLMTPQSVFSSDQGQVDTLNAFWEEASRVVAEGDFNAYKASYHEDAVLVSTSAKTSYPISQALIKWEQGFNDTRAGNLVASVEFRFTQRLHDATTAHETGIFHYSAIPVDGEPSEAYVHFEALLVNKNGWKTVMEFQKLIATKEEWQAASVTASDDLN